MRTEQQMQARVNELNTEVEAIFLVIKENEFPDIRDLMNKQLNQRCIERDAIRWCLDETRYPYPTDKPPQ